MSPGTQRFLTFVSVGLACVTVLALSYAGTTWYLGRPTSRPALVRRPAPATRPSPAVAAPVTADIVVHGTGDVLLDRSQLPSPRWDGVRGLFRSDAVTVVNLECAPGAGGTKQDKQYTFRCEDPAVLQAMRDAGVDVANQANNHSGDFGPQALMDGRSRLLRAGLAPVGSGHNVEEANAPAGFERSGKTIAVLGFGGVVPSRSWFATASRPGQSNGYDISSMVRAVRAADEKADLVFATIHWGEERDTKPRPDDVGRARALVDAGADAVFGHHAHRLQPLEWYRGRPIFYGLGNFMWPQGGATAIARVVVSPEGTFKACLLPATLGYGRPALTGATGC